MLVSETVPLGIEEQRKRKRKRKRVQARAFTRKGGKG
jgi:hypothetical protein